MPGQVIKKQLWWLVVAGIVATVILSYLRPVPVLKAQATNSIIRKAEPVNLTWPTYGQSAIGADGYGILESNNADRPVPIASTAKAITAMVVLKEKPLSLGQQGPSIDLTPADVALFERYYAMGGSVTLVRDGAKISQYQALQALMLPSSNNIADTLAVWAFGSMDNYLKQANEYVKSLGMAKTTIADASGFSEKTVSTAADMVLLGEAALSNATLSSIVSQPTANIPLAGDITNRNWLLGTDGVVGIKTGETDQAGGCYLFAAKRVVQEKSVTIIGVILGAINLNKAIFDARPLITSTDKGFSVVPVAIKKATLGSYRPPWSSPVTFSAANDTSLLTWSNHPVTKAVELKSIDAPAQQNSQVGNIKIISGEQSVNVPIVLDKSIPEPSWHWRIFH